MFGRRMKSDSIEERHVCATAPPTPPLTTDILTASNRATVTILLGVLLVIINLFQVVLDRSSFYCANLQTCTKADWLAVE